MMRVRVHCGREGHSLTHSVTDNHKPQKHDGDRQFSRTSTFFLPLFSQVKRNIMCRMSDAGGGGQEAANKQRFQEMYVQRFNNVR